VGEYLKTNINDSLSIHTYMSSDFGKTWKQISDQVCTVEVGANGGLIVMAPTYLPSTTIPDTPAPIRQVNYSIDYGKSWESLSLPSYGNDSTFFQRVYDLQSRPGNDGLFFFLYGRDTAMQSVTFELSFASLYTLNCTAGQMQTNHSASCHYGIDIGYSIRQASAQCLPTTPATRAGFIAGCGCRNDQQACGYGYWRSWDANGQAVCNPLRSFALDPGCPARDASAYRALPDNVCPAGGGASGGRFPGMAAAIAVPIVAVAACLAGFAAYRRGWFASCSRRRHPKPTLQQNDEEWIMSGSSLSQTPTWVTAPASSGSRPWQQPPAADAAAAPGWMQPPAAAASMGGYVPPTITL
jgi:hypothetical protein